jgi:ribosomal protein S18 acetylase RimI-like enzyme
MNIILSIDDKSLKISPIQPSGRDLQLVLDVYRRCEDFLALGPVPTASMDMVQADVLHSQQEGGIFCGIYNTASGEMLGIVDFVPFGWEEDPEQAYISLLMIAAENRDHGLGERVVQAVEEAIRREGRVRVICSGVQVNNPCAIRFWKRMGYAIVSPPEQQPDQTVAYRLRKVLNEK